jgi:two-component system, NtrC family, sensor histidine kinase HydH
MSVRLGIVDTAADAPLARRLAWVIAARLVFLTLSLGAIGGLNVARGFDVGSVTIQALLAILGTAFGVTAVYALVLRMGRALPTVGLIQLVLDQLIVTSLVYLTGGAGSGATSFYGVTCLAGAFVSGIRGASLAAAVGGVAYAVLVAALYLQWIDPPSDQPWAVYQVSREEGTFYVSVNFLVLVVVTLLSSYLAERLRSAGGRIIAAEVRADQAERLAALGRLATGLAHEIRNPLGSIAGSVELLQSSRGLDDEDRKLCEIIHRETQRLDELVSDMVNVARPKVPEIEVFDLSSLVREVVGLAGTSGRGGTDVAIDFVGNDGFSIHADPDQIRQVVWNLVRNAVQASSAGDCVRVGVESGPDGRVALWVEDDGVGLTDEAQEHIFDAFFTTRAQGTGIGLAVVKRIVDEHGFDIEVRSDEGRGARFTVLMGLPARPADGPDEGLGDL